VVSTAPALSASNLLKIVRHHKLADPDRLDEVVKSLPAHIADAQDSQPMADALVAAGLLTRFQSSLLLQGKSRSLTIAGKYRLVDRLGAGGMGLVYLCEHLKMRRTVAVKVLPQKQATEPGQLDRFLREAQAAAALKHPNIVQAYDLDQDAGVHYLVMEYIDGADLDRLVHVIGALEPCRAAYYIAQAALGLQHAAERGLVHRDIKPSNLLVDRDGVVKILDLGLARLQDGGGKLTERFDANTVIGTADYIAPEQALNSHEVDVRADIYALGCTFYFLLAGHPPFRDANVTQKLLMHQMREPPAITELRPDVPPEMASVVARMMAKDPEHRYQVPADVAEDLAVWCDPPPAPPTDAEIPPRSVGTSSPAGSSLNGRAQSTAAIPRAGHAGLTGAMSMRRTGSRTEAVPRPGKRWATFAGIVSLGVTVLLLAAWRPWSSGETPSGPTDPGDPVAEAPAPPPAPARTTPPRPGRGFVYLPMLPSGLRQPLVNGELRETPTDLFFVIDAAVIKSTLGGPDLGALFRRDAASGILPYIVATSGGAYPNALFGVNPDGTLRVLGSSDYIPPEQIGGARPDQPLAIRGPVALKIPQIDVCALLGDLTDVSAAPGGTTIKLNAGVALLSGVPGDRDPTLGAGNAPLTLDFAGRQGYLTVGSDRDFTPAKGTTTEYRIRARLVGFGTRPLVLSGMWGNVVALQSTENDMPALVVQGLSLGGTQAPDKVFRVTFNHDRQLGAPGGPVTLSDASLQFQGDGTLDVDRPLTLMAGRVGRLAATERAKGPRESLRWVGKVTGGGKLLKAGNAIVVLANGANDYWGGTEVAGGTLLLQADSGSPTGSGSVTVNWGATLAGTGRVPGAVQIRPGGNLQPGSDAGAPMRLNSLTFVRSKEGVVGNLVVRPYATTGKHLVYEGTAALDVTGVNLKVTPAAGFKPSAGTMIAVIENGRAPAVRGTFQNLDGGARVLTTDGKWTARISYQGDVKAGVPAGGKHVVLYDWAPVGK
jgi:autotransporter-associated beta strand protein